MPGAPALADGVVLPPPACFDQVVPPPGPVASGQEAAPAPAMQPEPIRPPITIPRPLPPVPPTPRPPIVPCWLTVRYHRVEVEINDQVATTRVDQVFANETGRDLEGTYVFPLPESATVTGFSMWVDGQRQDGEVLTREEARRLYESIVRRNRDPALLEYVGRGAFQARVFPVPAGGERRLQLEYTQALTTEGDVLRYVYPLNTERFSARPLQQAAVSVTLRSARPLKAIYSPSHEVSVVRQGENEAQVSWEAANVRPREDFELVFGVSPDPVGLHLLTHRPAGEDGYFLLLAAPAVRGPERPVAQDVTLVFDTSGSMAGAKMEQARGAMRYVLNRLRPEDRFNMVTFSSTVSPFAPEMQPAGSGERERALALVERLEATGGTNINDALTTALGLAPRASAGGVTAEAPPHPDLRHGRAAHGGAPGRGADHLRGPGGGRAGGRGAGLPLRGGARREHDLAGCPGRRVRRGERLRQAGGEPGGGRLRLLRPGWDAGADRPAPGLRGGRGVRPAAAAPP